VTSLTRSPLLPDVPTLDELGVRGYEVNTWFGFIAPAGTPPEIVARLNSEMNHILALNLASQGFELASPMSPPAFMKLIHEDMAKWIPIVKASGATAN
jgi:tripartite-type tricarboxylate transporter receptor subunit TctC